MKNTDGGYVVVTTIAHEESGESVQSEFPVFGNKPQEIGSSISYARRYNIQAMLDIPVEDDDGNKSNDAPRTKTYQADDKPWFNKPELAAMQANIHLIESSEDAVRIAKVKYKVSKEMEAEINNLF